MIQETRIRKLERGGDTPTVTAQYHIDPSAMPHLSQVLRNLYARPILAVTREMISNALDAHTSAGKPISEIEVALPTSEYPTFSVRDYGAGLSWEEAKQLLFGFGASGEGKRTSNCQIGGFGLGAKSFMAVTDQAFYTLYHGGTATKVRCYLDEKDIGAAEIVSQETSDEPTGILIEVPVKEGQSKEYVEAFVQTAWLMGTSPKVLRGLKPIVDSNWAKHVTPDDKYINGGDPKETWNLLLKYMDTPSFWRGKFSLNGIEVKWTWIPSDNVIQEVMGEKRSLWIKLGHQIYPVALSSITSSLKPEGSGIEFFESTLSNNSDGAWIMEVPIGTFPLAPSRETLQYSVHCQKMLVGAINALTLDWLTVAKKQIATYSSNLTSIKDYVALRHSGFGDKLSWVLKVLKRDGVYQRANQPKALDKDITKLVTWNLPETGVSCDVRLQVRSDMEEEEAARPWLIWHKDPTCPTTGFCINYYARRKRNAYRNNGTYSRNDYTIKEEEVTFTGNSTTTGVSFSSSEEESLFICCTPEEYAKVTTDITAVKRYPKLLLSFGETLSQSLGLLKLGPLVPAVEEGKGWWAKVRKGWYNRSSHGRGVLMALFVPAPKDAIIAKYPWVDGLNIIEFKDLTAAYKEAHKRIPKTVIDPFTGAAVSTPATLRAPPRPLDTQRYCMAENGTSIDVVALRDASSRPYIRTCRGTQYWPSPGESVHPSSIHVHMQIWNAKFPTMAAILDPGALGILETRAESSLTPNPDRYGPWVPLQDWFFEKLEARAKLHGISEAHMARLMDLLREGELLFPSGAGNTEIVDISSWDSQYNKEMKALYRWLRAKVTCKFGQGILDSWNHQYGFDQDGTWAMLRELITIRECLGTRDGWLDMPRKSAWAKAYGEEKAKIVALRQKVRSFSNPLLTFNTGSVPEYKKAAERIIQLNKAMDSTFHCLGWEPLCCGGDKKLWGAHCRRTWLIFEAAWSRTKCPVLPDLPK